MQEDNKNLYPIPQEVWLDLQTKQLDKLDKSFDGERKNRGKRELVLMVTCLLALLYTYPIQSFENNPNIAIPAVSLSIPLKDAVNVFPTLIAAIYLVFLSSAIGESFLMVMRTMYQIRLAEFERTGEIPKSVGENVIFPTARYMFLPTPLHSGSLVYGAAAIPKAIVDGFVGLVFTLLPYVTSIYIVKKSWHLLGAKTILAWNILCVVIMLLAFISAIMSSSKIRSLRNRF